MFLKWLFSGNLEEAVSLFTEAIKSNPMSALLYAKRGRYVLKKKGGYPFDILNCYRVHIIEAIKQPFLFGL